MREVYEETGLHADSAEMIGPVWRRDAIIDFNNTVIRSHELFFVHRTQKFDPSTEGHTALERRYIHGHRWCDADDLARWSGLGRPSIRCSWVNSWRRPTRWQMRGWSPNAASRSRSAEPAPAWP